MKTERMGDATIYTGDVLEVLRTMPEVALEYGRGAILIELKPEYVELAKKRLKPIAGRPMLDFVG